MTAAWQTLTLYRSPPHACSYLQGRIATNAVVDPKARLSPLVYAHLLERGFRRSGALVYRPYCGHCQACVATRIPVESFHPNRTQQKIWKRNQDLKIHLAPARANEEYFDLYSRYINTRHAGGSMEDPTPESFEDFLLADWCDTQFVTFREQDRLLCVSAMDVVPAGLSAVYTWFDPEASRRSLGTFAILWQIKAAQSRHLPYVYLGYWIENCRKMQYKTRFQLIEGLINDDWQLLASNS
jgi:arginine-tRNA-protein transferase